MLSPAVRNRRDLPQRPSTGRGLPVVDAPAGRRTLLHMACATGNYKLAETVIDLGADKNLKDR
eukprot:2218500-Rhodomonas_salina.3